MSKAEDLKPCPFCGGEAKLFRVGFDSQPENSILNGTYIIGCDGPHGSLCPGYGFGYSALYTTRELAVRMWNNRVDCDKADKKE